MVGYRQYSLLGLGGDAGIQTDPQPGLNGPFKKVFAKVLNHYTDKRINESNLTPEQKAAAKKQSDVAVDVVSNAAENDIKSGGKVLVTFVTSFFSGGPVKAFGDALSLASKETALNQHKFVDDAMSRGLPVYVNGKLVNPPPGFDPDPSDHEQRIKTMARSDGCNRCSYCRWFTLVDVLRLNEKNLGCSQGS